jgi:uncharacterized membrane protein
MEIGMSFSKNKLSEFVGLIVVGPPPINVK